MSFQTLPSVCVCACVYGYMVLGHLPFTQQLIVVRVPCPQIKFYRRHAHGCFACCHLHFSSLLGHPLQVSMDGCFI